MINITVRDFYDIKEALTNLSSGSPRKGLVKHKSFNSIYEERFSSCNLTATYYSPNAALSNADWYKYHHGEDKWVGTISYEPTDTIEHFVADRLSDLRFDILRFLKNRKDRVQVVGHYEG